MQLLRFILQKISFSSVLFTVFFCMTSGLSSINAADGSDSLHWVGTWACSPYKVNETKNYPSSELSNKTFRQIVRVSIGGDTLRVKFSNTTCAKAISIKAVTIAVSPDGTKCAVDASTIKQLKFKSDSSVTINAKSEVFSDPVAFKLTPSMRLAITTYYGDCASSTDMTFHYGSRTNSYLTDGNKTMSADFSSPATIQKWFTIAAIDVLAPAKAGAVVAFGNSITDGYGLADSPNLPGLQNRWTDIFSEKLLANSTTAQVGVLNQGIGGTCVLSSSNGADAGTTRFQPDVLNQAGVRWIIIFYGVNDIGNSTSDITNNLTNAYKSMVTAAHAKNIKVYGGTITPFKGSDYGNNSIHETTRQSVNKWIRTAGNFDGIIDFDKVLQNPNHPDSMQAVYSNGWLHPNVAGYKAMGESIDLKMFESDPVEVIKTDNRKYVDGLFHVTSSNGSMISFELQYEAFISLKVYSLLGKEIAELAGKNFSSGRHSLSLKNIGLAKGMYFYSVKVGEYSSKRVIAFPGN